MLLHILLLATSQVGGNSTAGERKGMEAIADWNQCVFNEADKIIGSSEAAETLADVALSQCTGYQENAARAWFPLYASIDAQNAKSDTDDAINRIRIKLRGNVLYKIVYSRISTHTGN